MKKLNLSIEKPCSENPENFQKSANGGFCNSCQKEVIDFTKFTDQEIKEYFSKKSIGSTCGSFRESQLKTYPATVRKPLWISSALLSSLLTITPLIGYSQEKEPVKTTQSIIVKEEATPPSAKKTRTITGMVISVHDSTGLPGINVKIKETEIGTVTDIDGNYSLEIPNEGQDYTVIFSFIGCKTLEKKLSHASNNKLNVSIEEDYENMEFITTGGVRHGSRFGLRNWFGIRSVWRLIKRPFKN